ncbi:lytic transglycosylase domain-containing protein [Chromobacterium sp. IIBBL 290-4]|uniref:lytic transglycosylase domain-containing protein n=1 Tax=Chromobacterium sp. IIBBL 290-4 TaxID=2953890 RepID=UPI0020B85F42|nr:lytic transglycosylase domain-containing protein [Chromobacterium sp. IIBBL 290-4]UTH73862.1 lytic transglycosylase domain-containing protein [Chromobacterium sp. IIBBL 290-4]
MKVLTHTLRLAGVAAALAAALPAHAGADDTLIAARDAFRGGDLAKLARLGEDLPANYPLKNYPAYWLAWKALDKNDDAQVISFLAQTPESLSADRIRNEWLKKLGMRENWTAFAEEWKKLPEESRDEESRCYGQLLQLRQGEKPADLNRFLDGKPAPDGCTRLIEGAYARGLLDQDWLWRRTRLLLAGNFVTQARQLAADTQLPLDNAALNKPASATSATPGGQEAMLYDIVRKAKTNIDGASIELLRVGSELSPDRTGFGWGQLALLSARKQQAGQALQWFERADPKQLTADQWEWWARSALRLEQWAQLDAIIRKMPAEVGARPAWRYWLGRSLQQQGKPNEASPLFSQASVGHNYYALLSLEELGNSLSSSASKTGPSQADIDKMKTDPAVRRSLALLNIAEIYTKPEFRTDAQREWRWAMRGRNDMELLAAAEIARKENFYDMAIYSAERTKEEHDFSLRYLTPYREVTQKYAGQLDIDDAWVYGLIRQESRFITMARSGVGASGLMQLMPATAKWAAKKIGLTHFAVNDIDTNVQLGTWYLRYVLDNLSGNMVMATAAYNAGPSRARAWQADRTLDGVIYAETIPFSETRDYVQKVMANAAYYSSTFGHANISLKKRMGVVPSR